MLLLSNYVYIAGCSFDRYIIYLTIASYHFWFAAINLVMIMKLMMMMMSVT